MRRSPKPPSMIVTFGETSIEFMWFIPRIMKFGVWNPYNYIYVIISCRWIKINVYYSHYSFPWKWKRNKLVWKFNIFDICIISRLLSISVLFHYDASFPRRNVQISRILNCFFFRFSLKRSCKGGKLALPVEIS